MTSKSDQFVKPNAGPLTIRLPATVLAMAILLASLVIVSTVEAQVALGNYASVREAPSRKPEAFGFPYPPPTINEPGVTIRRRFMLDGAGELEFRLRPQDQMWLISTRHLQEDEISQTLECFRVVDGMWRSSSVQALVETHQTDPSCHTLVFVHGNQTDAFWGQRRGKQAYQAVFGNHPDAPPVRFVIWSWPSDKLMNPIHDFEDKMDRAVVDGHMFCGFLEQIGDSQPVALMGYSLGTQVLLTGLRNLSKMPAFYEQGHGGLRYKMTVVAPVTHCDWPGCTDDAQMTAGLIESLTAFRNPRDRAIRAFKFYCRTNSNNGCFADGYGIDRLDFESDNFCQYDVSAQVGREHNMVSYFKIPLIQAMSSQMIE